MQAASTGQEGYDGMPPPPPRPALQLLLTDPGQQPDELLSSEDSDVDIDDTSPSQGGATAAWIEKQLQCPEPFLTAPELLSAKVARIYTPGGHPSAGGANPLASLAARNPLSIQLPAPVAPPSTHLSPPLPSFPLASALAGHGRAPVAHAHHRLSTPSGAICSGQQQQQQLLRSTTSLGADVGQGVNACRHGHKPPLYPAKRAHGEDTEARQVESKQQAHSRMSMFPSAQSTSGEQALRLSLAGVQPVCMVDIVQPQFLRLCVHGKDCQWTAFALKGVFGVFQLVGFETFSM